jgi:hypothetical protein
MALNTSKILRAYGMIPVFAVISGIAATIITSNELSSAFPATTSEVWPQTALHMAASAALAFQHDEGRLPATLDELRLAKRTYLPKNFALKGTMYFRDDEGKPPRLSWHDDEDNTSAYCRLDAAVHHHCI